jgi:hypothetical protein
MPHPLRRPGAFAALLALATVGCDNPSEPQGVAGRYSVYSVNGNRPPAFVRMSPGGEELLGGELLLADDGIVAVELETRVSGQVLHVTYSGVYQVTGDLLTFEYLTDGDRDITANGVVISPSEVAVTLHVPGPPSSGAVYHAPFILRR